ncbi:Nuclear control of ATPase protein 2 [Saitozyma podzolica]|uniref:Nuclear control of ATPase protein 2 n=1 Tax=Saitozyma podzolica TaxID=1890683 RepID=A0A427YMM3_9TREE|nr:Nuclear control of ATPase protein 2 [Saitozyma podzolica]
MSFLFTTPPPSYAEEQLSSHLSTLSTLPVTLEPSLRAAAAPPPALQSALHELSSTKPIPARSSSRAATMVWKEVLDAFVRGALELEEERNWWDSVVNSHRGVVIYLIQTLPLRLYKSIQPPSAFNLDSLQSFHFPSRSALFKPLPNASAALTSLTSPYNLTRREILSSRKSLTRTRDSFARRIGLLASQGPRWMAEKTEKGDATPRTMELDVSAESNRLYGLRHVLPKAVEIYWHGSNPYVRDTLNSARSVDGAPPQARSNLDTVLKTHRRPSPLTRFWFPLLFLPPAVLTLSRTLLRNKKWMQEQIRNSRETIRGFFVQWVWEPLEGIGKTLRQGGEGLGVAPTTVEADKQSLERMVVDLGKDYYHMSGPELEQLGQKSPVKNALMGHLVRALLIQTDLSLSLLSLDHLLRSQQLTFAFVGVAPSVLILYGFGGWLKGVWRGEQRGKGRRRRYFNGLRDIERLLLTTPKHDEEMSDRDRGLLIVSVSGLRTWAGGLGGNRDPFLGDLRMVEDPSMRRGDKLRVVERIWRCWGMDGRRVV